MHWAATTTPSNYFWNIRNIMMSFKRTGYINTKYVICCVIYLALFPTADMLLVTPALNHSAEINMVIRVEKKLISTLTITVLLLLMLMFILIFTTSRELLAFNVSTRYINENKNRQKQVLFQDANKLMCYYFGWH